MVKDNTAGSRLFDIALIVILVGIAILCILPIWYTLAVSLSNNAAASSGRVGLWPVGFNLGSYQELMGDRKFFNSFWISVQRVILGAGLNFVVILLMAYPLSKNAKELPYRNVLMWILVFTMLFNGGLIPWYMTVKSLGLINNIWALVLGNSVPVFSVILVINFFRNLPKELEEAALVDGAGPWRMMIQIFVPLAGPVIATVTLFSIVYHWNEFFTDWC